MLQTGADADQILAGDLMLVRVESDAEQRELTSTLATVFVTVPAIAFYVDEPGTRHDVTYPVAPGTVLPAVDGPDADSDVSVELTFWRPPRRPIPGELAPGANAWIDIGRLPHFAKLPGGASTSHCPQSSYSVAGAELAASPGFPSLPDLDFFLLVDSVEYQSSDPASTFSYTLNLSECQAFRGHTFDAGETRELNFSAALPAEAGQPVNSAESLYRFRHEP